MEDLSNLINNNIHSLDLGKTLLAGTHSTHIQKHYSLTLVVTNYTCSRSCIGTDWRKRGGHSVPSSPSHHHHHHWPFTHSHMWVQCACPRALLTDWGGAGFKPLTLCSLDDSSTFWSALVLNKYQTFICPFQHSYYDKCSKIQRDSVSPFQVEAAVHFFFLLPYFGHTELQSSLQRYPIPGLHNGNSWQTCFHVTASMSFESACH